MIDTKSTTAPIYIHAFGRRFNPKWLPLHSIYINYHYFHAFPGNRTNDRGIAIVLNKYICDSE